MRTFHFHSPQGMTATVQADVGSLLRIGRGDGRAGEISVVHQANDAIDVKISVDTLSSRHAEIRVLSSGVVVKDLGSTNGTLLPIGPGENRASNGRIQLGTEVTIEVEGEAWSFSEDALLQSAEDLASYLRTRLHDVGCRIELTSEPPEQYDGLRTILPLVRGQGHLVVVWPHGTVNLSVDRMLRGAVNHYNLRNLSSANDWMFTARSADRLHNLHVARRAAPFEDPILLLGPSGCGKGVLAQDIHEHSSRSGHHFVQVNCTAVPDEIFEREFFGHVRGAYTGASSSTAGFIQEADGGTLFLDEIGDMSLSLQAKLLTFLDNGEYRPVGSAKLRTANVRIIAATNKDVESMLGISFREDLYFRLMPITIHVAPPRPPDICTAVFEVAPEVACRNHVVLLKEELEQLAELASHRTYKGHFRELKSMLTRYLLMRENGRTIEQTWRAASTMMDTRSSVEGPTKTPPVPGETRNSFLRHIENYARLQLARHASSVQELASQAQQTTAAIYAWLKRAGLKPQDIGDTQAIREAIRTEVDALQPYLPLLNDICRCYGGADA